jgi:KRAB domain-containing zinc finger protein
MDYCAHPLIRCTHNGCTYAAPSGWQVKRHAVRHEPAQNRNHPCVVAGCFFVGKSVAALRAHSVAHATLSFSCDECDRVFLTAKTLGAHQRSHAANEAHDTAAHPSTMPRMWSYACQFPGCGRVCEGPAKLIIHQRMHELGKAFSCSECPFSTQWANALRTHAVTHRPSGAVGGFPCAVEGCNYIAALRHSLVVHERKHTCERPYACDVQECAYAAATKGNLVRHQLLRHGKGR